MSRIERYRRGDEEYTQELWDTSDISIHCNIPYEKADKLHSLANKEYGVIGYGEIRKEDFISFLADIDALKESQRLQDEANAATIIYSQKEYRLNKISTWVNQTLSLLSSL